MLGRLDRIHAAIREKHATLGAADDRNRTGTYLRILYDFATCTSGCRGGDHMWEYLCGRAFNLSYASHHLLQIGLYDEAFNQLRSLGELVNLVSLCVYDNSSFEAWRAAGHEARLRKFSPSKVRKLISASKGVLIVDGDLYSQLCELATHVTPQTTPNQHGSNERSHVGGSVQPEGFATGTRLLQHLLYFTCTFFTAALGDMQILENIPLPPSIEA